MSKPHINPYLVDAYYKGDVNAYKVDQYQSQADDNKAIIICLLIFVGLPLLGIFIHHRYVEIQREQHYIEVQEKATHATQSYTVPLR